MLLHTSFRQEACPGTIVAQAVYVHIVGLHVGNAVEVCLPFSNGRKLVVKVPVLETVDHVLFVIDHSIAEHDTSGTKIHLTLHNDDKIGSASLHHIGVGIVVWQENKLLVVFLLKAQTVNSGLVGVIIVCEVVVVWKTDDICTGYPAAVVLLSGRENAVVGYVDFLVLEVFNDLCILGFKLAVIHQGSPIHRLPEPHKVVD